MSLEQPMSIPDLFTCGRGQLTVLVEIPGYVCLEHFGGELMPELAAAPTKTESVAMQPDIESAAHALASQGQVRSLCTW